MADLVYLIPLLPFLGFVINGLVGKSLPKPVVAIIACGTVLGSFILSILCFKQVIDTGAFTAVLYDWIAVGNTHIQIAFQIDQLSTLMMLIITGIGFLIHMYSDGYMHDDDGFHRFFAYLNLFIFSMLLLVMGSNYMLMFFGWEGVGLCSYLLIGFWYKNKEFGVAARKAFIMNRIGDLGLLLGIFMIFNSFGSIEYADVFKNASAHSDATNLICILLFIGAMGKSAQIPLYTWLPDAMAGPTPVSALIHAATMVTAGIYLVVRSNALFAISPSASELMMYIGLATAMIAGTIGLKQNDIKKVLAYSTVSQLGFMFVALGVGAYTTAMFHVLTHAFFKALLFLGSGSVIHGMGGEQDIRKMGGLSKALPITHITFLIGTLAIAGVPFFSGFFSKDEILAMTHGHSDIVFALLAITAVITAVYMFRLYFLVFRGNFRGTHHQKEHLHESPISMTLPLVVLAVLSAVGGFLGMPAWMSDNHILNHFLHPIVAGASHFHPSELFEFTVLGVSIVLLTIIIFATRNYYITKSIIPESDEKEEGIAKVLSHKYYIDELYNTLFVKPIEALSVFLHKVVDNQIVDGIVNGIAWCVKQSSNLFRLLQDGKLEWYMIGMVAGVLLILALNFLI
ncbi:MAG: NADH-quinone oxidoreductase subunit L [Bacteroidota bacterium]|nr:NADH-quinone oxidoreductase subunit L [Bacteroidota bacterium]